MLGMGLSSREYGRFLVSCGASHSFQPIWRKAGHPGRHLMRASLAPPHLTSKPFRSFATARCPESLLTWIDLYPLEQLTRRKRKVSRCDAKKTMARWVLCRLDRQMRTVPAMVQAVRKLRGSTLTSTNFHLFAVRGAIRVSEHLLTARNAELSRANGQPGALCSPPAPSSVTSQQSLDVARSSRIRCSALCPAPGHAHLSENGAVCRSHSAGTLVSASQSTTARSASALFDPASRRWR